MTGNRTLQDNWPTGTCYGCGPANPNGLQLKSSWSNDGRFIIAAYKADLIYNSGMPGVMYGGTIASLIDCHSIWAAMAFGYRSESREMGSEPIFAFVTGELNIKYIKPTPLDKTIHLKAWVEGETGKKTRVLCELGPEGDITATGKVIAVRI